MDDVIASSRATIAKGSKSFAVASRLFAPDIRDDAAMLYAWCRLCDDVIDGQVLGQTAGSGARPPAGDARARLADLVRRTRAVLDGADRADPDPVFEAFRRVVVRHAIPARHPLELLAGFAMDVEARPYRTLAETLDYAYHVAGVVGVMMAMVMGVREASTLDRASDLGIAFQLTNIARDVVEDARSGRIYLPLEWLAEAGVPPTPEAVAAPENRALVHGVAVRLVDAAEPYYDSALAGLPALPFRSAWAIAAARRIYRAIGARLRANGPAAWSRRVVVPATSKAAQLGFALADIRRARRAGGARERDGLYARPTAPAPSFV